MNGKLSLKRLDLSDGPNEDAVNRVLLGKEIWAAAAKKLAKGAAVRKLAIAYVTEDHVGCQRSHDPDGQTDAKLLRSLHDARSDERRSEGKRHRLVA